MTKKTTKLRERQRPYSEEKGKKYQKSHPWITFRFDTRALPPDVWWTLGEAASTCRTITGTPLLPEVHERLMLLFMAKGIHATTAIEGNTLSEKEVEKRIEGKLLLPESKEYLGKEIDNVVAAYNFIKEEQMESKEWQITVGQIEEFNRLVMQGLPADPSVIPGKIRTYQVGVGGYAGAPHEDCVYLLNRYVDWLNFEWDNGTEQAMIFGILKAIVSHVYFEWIHPFGDGNGRTGRLIEFAILLNAGFPSTAAHLLSNHYNQTRSEYYRYLDIASASNGDLVPFIRYAVKGLVDQLRMQMETIKRQQLFTHWINYVHETLRDKADPSNKRIKTLMLEISQLTRYGEVYVRNPRLVSPMVAEQYAKLSDRTYQRDIELLKRLSLLVEGPDGYRPHWEILKAFMPSNKDQNHQLPLFDLGD